MSPDLNVVSSYFLALQDSICQALEREADGGGFKEDRWSHDEGGDRKSVV